MVLLAVLGSIDKSSTNVVSAVLLFVFNSFFAIGWLGMVCTSLTGVEAPSPKVTLDLVVSS
jgi:hypothetical protein